MEIKRNTHIYISLTILINISVSQCHNQFFEGLKTRLRLGSPAGHVTDQKLPPPQWFKQKLDHFNEADSKIWKQRYFVNEEFFDFKNPGPVFLMIGGEGPLDPKWMSLGTWIEYAKKFKALCISLEHRYYGESHPTKDLSVKNLQYLSSSQALADLANFIAKMNIKYRFKDDIKWIAFGGSYPGSLAAWLRLKYPHIVYASVASSAPLLAKPDFGEYFQVVLDALREKTGSEDCVNVLRQAEKEVQELVKTKPDEIEKEFKLCLSFSEFSDNDMKNFFETLAGNIAEVVQYNEDNRLHSSQETKNITINSMCNLLTSPNPTPAYKKLAEFNLLMMAKHGDRCNDYSYDFMIKNMRNTSYTSGSARQWTYQTCTEFGFFQTSSLEGDTFGNYFTLDFFVQQCQDIFGSKFDKSFINAGADWTNSKYGALGISTSRVLFVHGSVDPWHALGLISTKDKDVPVIYIRGTAHCANMYPATDADPSALVEARLEIEQYLKQWIEQL